MQPGRQLKKVLSRVAVWPWCAAWMLSSKMRIKADQKLGVKVVMRAIEEPLRQIANNAGFEGSVVIDKVKNAKGAFGYNAETNTYEDLMKAGVIDPTKVVRLALQNAASVASLMLTTQAMVADKPEEKQDAHARRCSRNGRRNGRNGRNGRHDVIHPVPSTVKKPLRYV